MFHSIIVNFIIPALLTLTFQSDPIQSYPVAADHSFETAVYIQKGLPAHDRKWGGTEYAQAVEVLRTIASQDTTQLPRSGSPKSGAMFARIIALDNLSLARDKTIDKGLRLQNVAAILLNVGQLTELYGTASTTDQVFDTELIELMRLTLEASQDVAQLIEPVFASVNPEARKTGMQQISDGFAQIVSGSLTTLTEKKVYRTSNLVRLAQTMETTLPAILSFLPPGTQQEIPVRLKQMIQQESNSELKARLIRISEALSNAKKG